MLVKTRGIILRSIKYGESSLIMDIYTEDHGLNSYIIGGVRSKNSKSKNGGLQLMSLVNLMAYHKSGKGLYRIKEVHSAYLYRSLPFEIIRSSVGIFMTEIMKNTLKEAEANPELFNFLFDWFQFLDQTATSISNLHLRFMLELAEQIGIQPRDNYSVNNKYFDMMEGQFVSSSPSHKYYLDEAPSELLYDFMMQDKENIHDLVCSNVQRRFLLDKLIQFYKLHVDSMKDLKSLEILNEILA